MKRHSHMMRFSVSHFDAGKAKVAKKYDKGEKGYLTESELAKLYVNEVPGAESFGPEDLDDALSFLGVSAQIRAYYMDLWEVVYNYDAATTYRGNFQIYDGSTCYYGNARTGRRYSSGTDIFIFQFMLDGFGTDFLIDKLDDAELVIGPKDFQGTTSPRSLTPGYSSRMKIWYWSRSGSYPVIYPNLLQCTASLEDMRSFAAPSGGISFFGRVMLGGKNYWLNRDGQSFQNFFVPIGDLQSSGKP